MLNRPFAFLCTFCASIGMSLASDICSMDCRGDTKAFVLSNGLQDRGAGRLLMELSNSKQMAGDMFLMLGAGGDVSGAMQWRRNEELANQQLALECERACNYLSSTGRGAGSNSGPISRESGRSSGSRSASMECEIDSDCVGGKHCRSKKGGGTECR